MWEKPTAHAVARERGSVEGEALQQGLGAARGAGGGARHAHIAAVALQRGARRGAHMMARIQAVCCAHRNPADQRIWGPQPPSRTQMGAQLPMPTRRARQKADAV